MGFNIVHMQKFKKGDLWGIHSHMKRVKKPKTNPDVDMERKKFNYDLIDSDLTLKDRVMKRVEMNCNKQPLRKDATMLCNFIITSDHKTMLKLTPKEQKAFFTDSYNWFANRYGKENVVFAEVHNDETTPHLHIGIVPMDRNRRLCCKEVFNKIELSKIQTEFTNDVGSKYGFSRGVVGSKAKHIPELDYKIKTKKKELEILDSLDNIPSVDEIKGKHVKIDRNEYISLVKQASLFKDAVDKEYGSRLDKNRLYSKNMELNSDIKRKENIISENESVMKDLCDTLYKTNKHTYYVVARKGYYLKKKTGKTIYTFKHLLSYHQEDFTSWKAGWDSQEQKAEEERKRKEKEREEEGREIEHN